MRRTLSFLLALALAGQAHAIGGDFALTDYNGQPYALSDDQGEVRLVFFGYTSCPDVCPTTLGLVAALMGQLGEQAEQVQPVFVSVDPQRDTPQRLREYLRYFHPDVVGVTGSEETLRRVTEQYGTWFRYHGESGGNYSVDHSGNMYVVGRDGELERIIPYGMPLSEMKRAVADALGNAAEGRS